jgi:hypothetical protein
MSSKTTSEPEYVWNFAVGSNLNPRTLQGRRKINPIESIPGICRDYALAFQLLQVPYLEPAMAGVTPRKGAVVHGLLIKLTRTQFDYLYLTEGGPNGPYKLVPVDVDAYDGRKQIKAFAFAHRNCENLTESDEGQPSFRYKNLILEGAKLQKLDANYISHLEAIEAHSSSVIVKAIFLLIHFPIIAFLFLIMTFNFMILRTTGWTLMQTYISKFVYLPVTKLLWLEHDLFFSKIFGNGGRKIIASNSKGKANNKVD